MNLKNKIKYIAVIVLYAICSFSCGNNGNKKSNIPYVDYSEESLSSDETIDIPYNEEGGVKMVTAKINGTASIDMIFDTGCSEALISILEAQQLIKRGLLTENDYLGNSKSVIADGSIVEDMVFNLNSLELTNGEQTIICRDVQVSVSSSIEAPVLLGNGVLDRVSSYEIDNENKVIKFKLK